MYERGTNVGGIYYECTLDTQKLIQQSRAVEQRIADLASSFNVITLAVKALAIAISAVKLVQIADEFRQLETRVKVAADSVEAGTVAFDRLFQMSQRTQTALAGNVEVFTRLNQSIVQMGGTQEDTLRMTELLGKAIKVSGVSAGEAKAAMLQFGQALGSGKLQGDELRSLMETAPYLMRQLANSIGVPVGQLKSLGEQGKLTADVVANALNKAASKITSDFEVFPASFTDAFQAVREQAAMTLVKLDDLTSSSAALTGATQGLGEVLDRLAAQFGAANEKAGALGRDDTIKSWSQATKTALSYVADAADVTWQALSVLGRNVAFVFTGVKNEVVGIGQQIAAVARGDFSGAAAIGDAMKRDAEQRRSELDAADARTLEKRKLFGEQMREAWEQGAGGGRGFVNPEASPSKLKSPKDPEEARKAAAKTAAAQAYYQALVAANAQGLARIEAEEKQALADNRKRMIEDKDNAAVYQKARTEIVARFARERALLEESNTRAAAEAQIATITDTEQQIIAIRDETLRQAQREYELGVKSFQEAEAQKTRAIYDAMAQQKALREQRQQTQVQTLQIRAQTTGNPADQVAAIRGQGQLQIDALNERAQADLDNWQTYADQKIAITEQMEQQIQEVQAASTLAQYAMAQSAAGQMLDVLRRAGKERTAMGKALFLAERALAVATIILNTEMGAQKAVGIAGPFGIPMATAIRATGYASAGLVAGLAIADAFGGGRQYGGPVSADNFYRVNETGRPEMFTASNGAQYMLPTSGGNITPASEVGAGGVQWTIIVNNSSPGAAATASVDQQSRTVTIAVNEVASQIAERRGSVWRALGTTNVQGRPGG